VPMLATPPSGWSKSIYYAIAPAAAAFPYVIFNKQSGVPTWSFAASRHPTGSEPAAEPAFETDVWLIKGVDHPNGTDSDVAEAIQARLTALLDDAALSIAGETLLYLRVDSPVQYAEPDGGEVYQHAGAMYRVIHGV